MQTTMLLETYLKQLRLPTFLHNYGKFAEDAARASLSYDRYLLALAEQEGDFDADSRISVIERPHQVGRAVGATDDLEVAGGLEDLE